MSGEKGLEKEKTPSGGSDENNDDKLISKCVRHSCDLSYKDPQCKILLETQSENELTCLKAEADDQSEFTVESTKNEEPEECLVLEHVLLPVDLSLKKSQCKVLLQTELIRKQDDEPTPICLKAEDDELEFTEEYMTEDGEPKKCCQFNIHYYDDQIEKNGEIKGFLILQHSDSGKFVHVDGVNVILGRRTDNSPPQSDSETICCGNKVDPPKKFVKNTDSDPRLFVHVDMNGAHLLQPFHLKGCLLTSDGQNEISNPCVCFQKLDQADSGKGLLDYNTEKKGEMKELFDRNKKFHFVFLDWN